MGFDVLMLTNNDWANSSFRYAKCLEMLGLRVKLLKGREHHCGYPEQGEVHEAITKGGAELSVMISAPELRSLAEEAHVLHFTASTFVDTGVDLRKKNVIVQHGGTMYRMNHQSLNAFFNRFVGTTIIQMPDLLGLGAKNEVWISFPVDTDRLVPQAPATNGGVKIGHFPTNPMVKGMGRILQAVKAPNLCDRFEYVGIQNGGSHNLIPWAENLDRMRGCDILIEACSLRQMGRRYGEWGNTVVEAAALGKVVITNSLSIEQYEREYGKCPLHIANNTAELKMKIEELLDMSRTDLIAEGVKSREWVVRYHSMRATAEKLRDKVYSRFFNFDDDGEIS